MTGFLVATLLALAYILAPPWARPNRRGRSTVTPTRTRLRAVEFGGAVAGDDARVPSIDAASVPADDLPPSLPSGGKGRPRLPFPGAAHPSFSPRSEA